MRNRFDKQLVQLNDYMLEMGSLIEQSIEMCVKALVSQDEAIAKQTIEADDDIDNQEKKIEDLCLQLLLQQQPVASDMRVISSALKMVTDMERIGDQAADIADLSKHIEDKAVTGDIINIRKMAEDTVRMVTESIDAFVKGDLELCRQVIDDDDKVDNAFNEIKEKLVEILSSGNPDARLGLDILMAAKYFERIGDHAVNIAEWVEYSITGVHRNSASHTDNYLTGE